MGLEGFLHRELDHGRPSVIGHCYAIRYVTTARCQQSLWGRVNASTSRGAAGWQADIFVHDKQTTSCSQLQRYRLGDWAGPRRFSAVLAARSSPSCDASLRVNRLATFVSSRATSIGAELLGTRLEVQIAMPLSRPTSQLCLCQTPCSRPGDCATPAIMSYCM